MYLQYADLLASLTFPGMTARDIVESLLSGINDTDWFGFPSKVHKSASEVLKATYGSSETKKDPFAGNKNGNTILVDISDEFGGEILCPLLSHLFQLFKRMYTGNLGTIRSLFTLLTLQTPARKTH